MSEPTENVNDENLVAYLDGELPESEATRIEDAAQNDKALRRRIDELQDSWALLDELPDEKVNANLAQSTLEMVALEMGASRTWREWAGQFRIPLLIATCGLVLGGGLALGKVRSYFDERAMLQKLPIVIVNDRLTAVASEEFLQFLATIKELPSTIPMREAESALSPRILFTLDLDQRREWVNELPVEQQQVLASKIRDYKEMEGSESGVEELKEAIVIANFIASTTDQKEQRAYVAAMNAYHAMVHDNTSFKIDMSEAIASGDQDAQRRLIYNELAYRYELTDSDRFVLREWASEWYLYQGTSSLSAGMFVMMYLIRGQEDPEEVAYWLGELENDLEGTARELFTKIDTDQQRDVALTWLNAATSGSDATGQELLERFAELPERKKDELMLLPADHVRDFLTNPSMQLE
ncbi:MAG: hypothetical protein Aurels2KO_31980 [Aureliella sp.]